MTMKKIMIATQKKENLLNYLSSKKKKRHEYIQTTQHILKKYTVFIVCIKI